MCQTVDGLSTYQNSGGPVYIEEESERIRVLQPQMTSPIPKSRYLTHCENATQYITVMGAFMQFALKRKVFKKVLTKVCLRQSDPKRTSLKNERFKMCRVHAT